MPAVQTVVNLIAQPPFGIVSRDTGAGVLTAGLTQIYRYVGPINVDAIGIAFSFITIPAEFGRFAGVTWEYERRIVQFAAVYTSLPTVTDPGGHAFYAGFTDVYREGEYYFFPQLFPTRIDVYVTTGCTVSYDWLCIF